MSRPTINAVVESILDDLLDDLEAEREGVNENIIHHALTVPYLSMKEERVDSDTVLTNLVNKL